MKYLFLFLLPLFSLHAQDFHPFGFTTTTLNVDKTSVYNPQNHNLSYFQSDAAFTFTYPWNRFGLMLGSSWVGTNVALEDNPEFNETFFNYLSFSLGGFSQFTHWLWTLNLTVNLDMATISLNNYALYQGVLWGRYNATSWLELDIGVILELGLNKKQAWPIIGFCLTPCPWARLHMIYPVDISLEVDLCRQLTLAGSIQFLRNRHRTLPINPNSMCIFEYLATGAEFDAILTLTNSLEITGFFGHTFDGHLKISDSNNKHPTYYKFRGSFYFGGSAGLIF